VSSKSGQKARKAFYERCKAAHKCVNCGKQDKRTLAGRIYCGDCDTKQKHYIDTHREQQRAVQSAANARRYYRLQESHRCVNCGVSLPEDYYYVCCKACRERKKKKTA